MPASRDTRLQSVLPAAILAVLLAVLWVWCVPRANEAAPSPPGFDTWDFHNYFLPRYVFGTQELLAGRLPLWNRLEFAGLPFLATLQPAALYPPKILAFALFEPEAATTFFLIAHYLLIAGGFLLFLRAQGIGGLGALAGGAYLTFNGMLLISGHHPNRIGSLAWIPVIFWLADRVAKSQRRAPIAALAVAVALQLLVGYPEFTLHTALLLGVQAIAMWATGAWPTPPWRTLPRLALGVRARRNARRASARALRRARHRVPAQRPGRRLHRRAGESDDAPRRSHGILQAMLQFLPGLSAFSLAALTRRSGIPPFAANVVATLMGAGGWLLLRELPIFSGIRHGLIWIVTAQFAIAWLIAVGADAFATPSGRPRRDRAVAWIVGLGALQWGALCLLGLLFPAATAAVEAAADDAWRFSRLRARSTEARSPMALGLAGSALLAIAAFAATSTRARVASRLRRRDASRPGPRRRLSPGRQRRSLPPAGSSGPARAPRDAGAAGRSRADAFDRGPALGLHVLRSQRERLRTRDESSARAFSRAWRRASISKRTGTGSTGRLSAPPRASSTRSTWSGWSRPSRRSADSAPVSGKPSERKTGASARRPPSRCATASARAAPGWSTARASRRASPRRSIACSSPSFDPRREVILEAPLASVGSAPASDPPTPARVQVVSPTHVEVEAELPRPGILVLSESWFPGWVADGRRRAGGDPARGLRAAWRRARGRLAPRALRVSSGFGADRSGAVRLRDHRDRSARRERPAPHTRRLKATG